MITTHVEYPNIFGNISRKQFLNEYWQQKPLLVRQAMPGITPPFTPEELAGLCCDIETSSRIVIENGKTPWEAKYSPFDDQDFLDLPDTHWTLLVNDLETLYPELQNIIQPFNFIPNWRVDDLMVSYAADSGSVGPHIDEYDVFLIQLQGKRRWQLDMTADKTRIIPDLELRILQSFDADHDWVLEPGDMLYLPPDVAHYGVAVGDCMTYSVGFRSPRRCDLLANWLEKLAAKPENKIRYNDARRLIQENHGKITESEITQLKEFLLEALVFNNDDFREWLGETLTESKHDHSAEPVTKNFNPKLSYQRSPEHKIAWMQQQNQIQLFVSGQQTTWPEDTQELIETICANHIYKGTDLTTLCKSQQHKKLLNHLVHSNVISHLA